MLPGFDSLSHLSLSHSSFSTPGTLRHVCCCGKRWRASQTRDRSCSSDPGQQSAAPDLQNSFYGAFMVARSMSECHPEAVDGDRASPSLATSCAWSELHLHSARGTNSSLTTTAGAQCYRSLLSLDVSGITCLCDAELEALLCNHVKLVALAVSTGAAVNAGMRAAAGLCDLRHLDISFLGFTSPDGGTSFTSEAMKATALSETLTAICSAAAQRSTARLETSHSSPDPSEAPLATLCQQAPWWRSSDRTPATDPQASGVPHATVDPSATFHLSIDLQLLVAFDRLWLRESFSTIPNRALTIRHHASSVISSDGSCSHTDNPVQSLVAAVSPEPSRILHVLLPEIIVGPARLAHLEFSGIETTESLLRHLLRLEEPPLATLRLQNFDPDRAPATSALATESPHGGTGTSAYQATERGTGGAINEHLRNCMLHDPQHEAQHEAQRTAVKKAKLAVHTGDACSDMRCRTSACPEDNEVQKHANQPDALVCRAVASHPLQNMQSYTATRGVHSRCIVKTHQECAHACGAETAAETEAAAPWSFSEPESEQQAGTSRGKRPSRDREDSICMPRPSSHCGNNPATPAVAANTIGCTADDEESHRAASSNREACSAGGHSAQRRSALQSALLAARWRRPSAAILRQLIDAHGLRLRCLHLSDLAGAPTVLPALKEQSLLCAVARLRTCAPVSVVVYID